MLWWGGVMPFIIRRCTSFRYISYRSYSCTVRTVCTVVQFVQLYSPYSCTVIPFVQLYSSYSCSTTTNFTITCSDLSSRSQITQDRSTFRPSRHVARASTQSLDINVPHHHPLPLSVQFTLRQSCHLTMCSHTLRERQRERLNKSNHTVFRKLSASYKASRIHRGNACVKITCTRKRKCQLKMRGKSNRTHR
jgi:hypothetical protein